MTPNSPSVDGVNSEDQQENVLAILALLTLLIFFFAYCCWGTSCCQKISSKFCFCHHDHNEVPQINRNISVDQNNASPTIILLPCGRILVVDGTIFARFHAEHTGLDLFELGDSVARGEREPTFMSSSMTRSRFLEFETEERTKDVATPPASPLPPAYESIFGDYQSSCTPPPYSVIFRNDPPQNYSTTNEQIDIRESSV